MRCTGWKAEDVAVVLTLLLHISYSVARVVSNSTFMDCIACQASLSFNVSVILDKSLAFWPPSFPIPEIGDLVRSFIVLKLFPALKFYI